MKTERKVLPIHVICDKLEKAALATKNDKVFNILISTSGKLERQVGAFAPKMTEAELAIVKMYMYED